MNNSTLLVHVVNLPALPGATMTRAWYSMCLIMTGDRCWLHEYGCKTSLAYILKSCFQISKTFLFYYQVRLHSMG